MKTETDLKKMIEKITYIDRAYERTIHERWNHLAKPIGSLGLLEDMVARLGAIQENIHPSVQKRAIVVMAGDHGVVAEGVTQTGQEVTKSVMENMLVTASSITPFAKISHADVIPVDVGIASDIETDLVWKKKVRYGTGNIRREAAMTRAEAVQSIFAGLEVMKELKENGYQAVATGEMGIGNTTMSSAICAYLLHQPVEMVTGKGAGLPNDAYSHKIQVIKDILNLHKPDENDMIDVLTKIGGLELGGLIGCFLGAGYYRMPIIVDGFISSVAAYMAIKMAPEASDYLFASHCSEEPAGKLMLNALGLKAYFYGNMRLGEGTGAAMCFSFMDYALAAYEGIPSFDEAEIEEYTPFEELENEENKG
ncbi:MAG: nicotinate-nucleotide--dimethylbenzimidazole phosphoribosyltransferase [Lachnospiraceae bacterium]|nr:nicotinate-nucleotide--dimethylbenzimidazole phosphoribosyltransferase [Lachnospiraceae bacterium]